ncbi:hypothetical protein [Aeromicrobium sp. UC242_57]|uniref:hypothetical protein n=1 Tax=Aeromicrobium sp. UC242_57 TaxID=3374624 RepID=UPI0037ADA5F6
MIFVAAVVLLAGLATAPLALAGAKARPPLAANIPGQPSWVSPTPPFRFRVWAIVAALTTALTVAMMLLAPEFQVAAAFLSAAALGMVTAVLRRYATGCEESRRAVAAFEPRIAMPYAGKVGVHIGMWSPWIERTGIPWVIVARTPGLFHELAQQYPGTPIVQGKLPGQRQGRVLLARRQGQHRLHRGFGRYPRVPRARRQRQAPQRVRTGAAVRPHRSRRPGRDRPVLRGRSRRAGREDPGHRPSADRGHRARRQAGPQEPHRAVRAHVAARRRRPQRLVPRGGRPDRPGSARSRLPSHLPSSLRGPKPSRGRGDDRPGQRDAAPPPDPSTPSVPKRWSSR